MSRILAALYFDPGEFRTLFERAVSPATTALGAKRNGHLWLSDAPEVSDPESPIAATIRAFGDIRIDNREQLWRRLADNHKALPPQASDADLVSDCYRAWGTAAFERLDGDFAFVLWDAERKLLYCVRDALGMRSVFYHQDSRRLLVASTIKQLFESDATLARQISAPSVGAYLVGQRSPRDATFFDEIHRLPAGHWLEAMGDGKVRVVRFWDPTLVPLIRHQSANDYADDFRQRFLDSVRRRLPRASSRIGLHVSGGFDSSAIVAATHYWNERLDLGLQARAFTNLGAHPPADERVYINEMLARFPMEQLTTRSEDFWGFRLPNGPLIERDEPFLPAYFARYVDELETAQRLGIQVLLSGAGGDEIGGSSMYLVDLIFHGRLLRFWPELKARASGKQEQAHTLLKTLLSVVAKWMVQKVVAKPNRLPPWFNHDFAQSVKELLRQRAETPIFRGPAREHLFRSLEFCWTEPLFSQSHIAAQQFGVEMRHPFMDRRLFEWALAVPPFRFGENGRVKAPLRRALADLLPEAIVNRSDKGRYGYYFDIGLREKERPRILEFLRNPISAELGYVVPGPLRAAYDEYCKGGNIDRGQFWNWLTLEQWLRALHHRQPP